ncbi:hypothetical protein D1872_338400 [compost metagenome]
MPLNTMGRISLPSSRTSRNGMGKKESSLRTGRVCSCRFSLLSRLTLSHRVSLAGFSHTFW